MTAAARKVEITVIQAHLAATWMMVGVIWFVQVCHYPLFAWIPEDAFPAYEAAHRHATTTVVLPTMAVEAFSTVWLTLQTRGRRRRIATAGLALLALIWAVTFFVQVPLHAQLQSAFSTQEHASLVRNNWWRTIAWTLRGILALTLVSGSEADSTPKIDSAIMLGTDHQTRDR